MKICRLKDGRILIQISRENAETLRVIIREGVQGFADEIIGARNLGTDEENFLDKLQNGLEDQISSFVENGMESIIGPLFSTNSIDDQ